MAKKPLSENLEAVQANLGITQNVISRVASNCSASKSWCITIVSAILVIVADKGKPQFTYLAIIPTALFTILDAYYLGLEKAFRNSYNEFIDKLHRKELIASDLYHVNPKGNLFNIFFRSLFSFSVWPFYVMLSIMIFLAKYTVIS